MLVPGCRPLGTPGPARITGGHCSHGARAQEAKQTRESGHDITILLGSEYFLSCQLSDPSHTLHSHSRPPLHYLTDWNMTQENPSWILVNLSPCHENCPRHAGLASWHVINARPAPRDTWGRGLSVEWWPGPVSSARLSEITIEPFVCLSLDCVWTISMFPGFLVRLSDEWFKILFCLWWREWRKTFNWYTKI